MTNDVINSTYNPANYEIATEEEYAAFKSHMETEIENILTPIT